MANPLVERWQNASVQDPLYRRDLNHLIRKDLSVRFQEPLVFGTAGMRGLMGFGPDRINELTIAAASQAYAQYLRSLSPKVLKQGVIIGHDNRANSDFFAKVTYDVLRAHQIKAFLFEANELQPSPLVSYTVRKLSLAGGIVITASHNPKQYNGFKVYDHLGGQLTGEAAKTVQTNMVKIDPLDVKRKAGSYSYVSQDIVESYIQALLQLRQRPDDSKVLKVVFSPLHGTGGKVGNELLKRMNIDHLNVSKQMEPDPEFSSLKSPNPEDGHAFARSVSLARTKKADLVVVTDPDADRLGVVVKYKHRFKYLNGNQVAALYLDYLINQLKLSGQLPKRGYIIKTTVSGQLPVQIARRAGLKVYETHVGFKNIAEKIESLSQTNQQFVFAYEESYGFLLNPSVSRDKDALQALVGVVEMANYYKTQGTNLYERLLELFKMHGIHRSIVMSKVLTPSAQAKLFTRIKKVRKIAGLKVVESVDYNIGRHSLPNQNMLKITLSNGTWFAIRPSGTEPKVKIYIQTIGTTEQELVDIVTTEKTISNLIEDNIESPIATKIKASSVIRYGLFIAVIAALLAIVFLYVYKGARNRTVFDVAHLVFSSQMRIVWFSLVV
ncbi:uncharacterized protein LOC111613624 [Centruroides sculpturatus]|uniref:uncharacterized protein LOC111613624 n=1 Tax=Centruroides sculpturatus TaxID=218467 RepID=UPI000C6E6087|nr:uncharacterized protein LOC111613624 [Centruroides sculpturatus]